MNSPAQIHTRLELAANLHRQGKADEAVAIYREILAIDPRQPDATHLLGVFHCQRKEFADALPYLAAAIALAPSFADAHIHYAKALRKLDRSAEAITLLDGFANTHPDNPEILAELGLALRAAGDEKRALEVFRQGVRLAPQLQAAQVGLAELLRKRGSKEEALKHFRAAAKLNPADVGVLNSLGTLLKELGQHDEALQVLRHAVGNRQGFAVGHNNLGNLLLDGGKLDAAIGEYRAAIAAQADFPEAWNNLGNALKAAGRIDEAIGAYRESLRLRPGYAEAMSNLGNALLDGGRYAEALASQEQATAAKPDFAEGWNNLANVYATLGRHAEALKAFDRAIECDPASHQARFGRSLERLMLGDFSGGWEDYEHRWWGSHMADKIRPPRFAYPQWDGTPPRPGQRILVYHEQGFGDTIQFARYLPLLAARFAEVVFICQKELARLFAASFGSHIRVVPAEASAAVVAENFDWHAPLLSLPRAFRTTADTIPGGCPYLFAPAPSLATWRRRIGPAPLRVGLCWRGNPELKDNRFRDLPPAMLSPLAAVEGIRWYGLVMNAGAEQPALPNWTNPMADVADFADSAALIACLDLVLTVDTSVAHLAGALAKPVWLLCRYAGEWRWQPARADSPWYGSMRIFRQPALGDWPSLIGTVADELQQVGARVARRAA